MPRFQALLDIQTTVAAWRRFPRLCARLQSAAQATLDRVPSALRFPAQASVLLTGNAKVRQLNRDFRGTDQATNVLSFPQFSPAEIRRFRKQKDIVQLGDIALAYQYVAAEAKREDKLLIDHATHLVIHGLLHLFGYDHGRDGESALMEKMEIEIMKSLGLPDPYAPPLPENKKRKQ
jgi:probable rRNA maturation factor